MSDDSFFPSTGPTLIAGQPVELMLPVALYAVAGIYLLQGALRALPDSFRLFDNGFFPNSLAFVLLVLVLLVGALGVGLLSVALLLYRGDRVARGFAYIAAATMFGLVAFGGSNSTGDVLSMLAALVAAGLLAFAPACQQLFRASGRQEGQPDSIVLARAATLLWLVLLGVVTVLYFCLGQFEGRYYAYGILVAAVGIVVFNFYKRLAVPDRQARLWVSGAAGLVLLLLLISHRYNGFAILIGLTAAIPAALWLPTDARAFYGDPPLRVTASGPT